MNLEALGTLSERLRALEGLAGLEPGQLLMTVRLRLPISAELQANRWLAKATLLGKKPWWYWKRYRCFPAQTAQALARESVKTALDEG